MYLFNSKISDPGQLEKLLIGRKPIVDRLEEYIQNLIAGEHLFQYLLIGPRGSGKTHILRVLFGRISQIPNWDQHIAVAYMVEDEYGISDYVDFMKRILQALNKWTPQAEEGPLHEELNKLKLLTPHERIGFLEQTLLDILNGRNLLILIENLNRIFKGIGPNAQARFRDFIQTHDNVSIIGTSQQLFPEIQREDRPFLGFFTIEHLKRLTFEESLSFLQKIAQAEQDDHIIEWLRTPKAAAQAKTIYLFTEGNHRLTVLFYDFVRCDQKAELSDTFLRKLDELKPYYESLIINLTPLQQKIIQYLSLNRGARSGKEIALECLVDSNTLSKQTSILSNIGFIEGHRRGKNKYYELSEPLMRLCFEINEDRQGIIGKFVDLLAHIYEEQELIRRYLDIKSGAVGSENANMLEKEANMYHLSISKKIGDTIDLTQQNIKEYKGLQNEKQKSLFIDNILKKVSEKAPKGEIKSLLQKATQAHNTNNNELAISALLEVIKLNPKNDSAWYNLGNLHVKLEQYEDAENAYKKAIKLNPKDEAWHNLGVLYNELEQYKEAENAYKKAIKLNPKDDSAWYNLGVLYKNLDQYEDAENAYKKAIKLNPKKDEAWYNLGVLYNELEQYKEAENAYKKAIKLNPKDDSAWYNLGNLHVKLDQYEDAENAYKKAIKLNPKKDEAWHNLGVLYNELEQYKEAENAYKKAIKLNPKDDSAWYNLGNLHVKLDQYEDAENAYKKAIKLNPKKDEAWHNLGVLYNELEQYKEAENAYKKAIKLNPKDDSAWYNLGVLYKNLDQYEDAENAYKKAIKLNPKKDEAWYNLGVLYNELEQYKEAENAYKKAIKLNPKKDDSAWYNLGNLHVKLDQYEDAENAYKKAIKLNPKKDEAWHNLGVLYKNLDQYEDAEMAYKKALAIQQHPKTAFHLLILFFKDVEQKKWRNNFDSLIKIIKYADNGRLMMAYLFKQTLHIYDDRVVLFVLDKVSISEDEHMQTALLDAINHLFSRFDNMEASRARNLQNWLNQRFGDKDNFETILRFLDRAIQYVYEKDDKALLKLSKEEREVLLDLLGEKME